MPRSRGWQTVPVDQRVREAGGWLGPQGCPTEPEPDMAGAFTALRRMNDAAFETARDDEAFGVTVYSDTATGHYGPTTGFQTVAGPTLPAPTRPASPPPAGRPDHDAPGREPLSSLPGAVADPT